MNSEAGTDNLIIFESRSDTNMRVVSLSFAVCLLR
jgi:hypothetical protein